MRKACNKSGRFACRTVMPEQPASATQAKHASVYPCRPRAPVRLPSGPVGVPLYRLARCILLHAEDNDPLPYSHMARDSQAASMDDAGDWLSWVAFSHAKLDGHVTRAATLS